MTNKKDNPILLFDGVCNLCVGSVQFFIKHDKSTLLRFASLQSGFGIDLKAKYNIEKNIDSLILINNKNAYTHSSAAILAASNMGFLWKAALVLLIIPKPIRDTLYKWIARNRYKWFGKKTTCWLPTEETSSRFLD